MKQAPQHLFLAALLTLMLTSGSSLRAYLAQVQPPSGDRLHVRALEEERATALLNVADQLRLRGHNASSTCRGTSGVMGESKSLFVMSSDGRLRNATGDFVILDRETLCNDSRITCWLNFTVMHCGQLLELAVEIMDVNDWQPTFPSNSLQVSFSEADLQTTRRRLPLAIDRDAHPHTVRRYTLRKSSPSDPFCLIAPTTTRTPSRCESSINWLANNTDLYLQLNARLDHETHPLYHLELYANDSTSHASLNLTVVVTDVNDNPPRFPQHVYYVNMSEMPHDINAVADTHLLTVSATDADTDTDVLAEPDISYSLEWSSSDDVNEYLKIDEDGNIRARNAILDFERHPSFAFRVIATDNRNGLLTASQTGTTEVIVNLLDINDNAPIIKIDSLSYERTNDNTYLFSVTENGTEQQQFIAKFSALDADTGENARATCSVTPDSAASKNSFLISRIESASRGTEYLIKTARVFDREQVNEYNIDVTCHDYGKPQLSANWRLIVRVSDVNDNAPRFSASSYSFPVSEDAAGSEHPIGTFDVTDADDGPNAELQFSIDSNVSAFFAMDNNRLILNGLLDREVQDSYTFYVYVRDLGEPALTASALVRVRVTDVNDNPPTLNRTLHIEVQENIRPESLPQLVYTVKVHDADAPGTPNSNVSFLLLEGGTFIIDKNGNLFLNARLDRETQASYQFQLLVHDNGDPQLTSTCTVSVTVIDLNDVPPVFTLMPSNRTTVRVPSSLEYPIVTFEARDGDGPGENSRVRYAIISPDEDIFSINETSGQVYLRRFVNGGVVRQIKLVATDGGRPSLSATLVHTIELVGPPSPPQSELDEYGVSNLDSNSSFPSKDRSDTIYIICAIVIGISACLAIFIIILILIRNRNYQRNRRTHEEGSKMKQRARSRRPSGSRNQSTLKSTTRSRPQSRNDAMSHHTSVFSTADCHVSDDYNHTLKVAEAQCDSEKACNMPMLPASPLTVEYDMGNANRSAQIHSGFLQSNLLMNPQATLAQPPFMSQYKMTAFCVDCDACRQTLNEAAHTQSNRTDRYQFSRPSSSATVKRPNEVAQLTYQTGEELCMPRSTSTVLRRLEETAASSKDYNNQSDRNSSDASSDSCTGWDEERSEEVPHCVAADSGARLRNAAECNNNSVQSIISGLMTNLNANRVRTKSSSNVGSQKIAVQEVRPFVFDLQPQFSSGPFETVTMAHTPSGTVQQYRANSAASSHSHSQGFKPLRNPNFEHSFV